MKPVIKSSINIIFFKTEIKGFLSLGKFLQVIITIVFSCLFITCCTSLESNEEPINGGIKVSHFMGDSNFVFHLPNLLNCKSSLRNCFSESESLIWNCQCLINTDTIDINVITSTDFNLPQEKLNDIDTLLLSQYNSVKTELLQKPQQENRLVYIRGREFLIKQSAGMKDNYLIQYISKTHFCVIRILGIKDQSMFNDIIQTFDMEKRKEVSNL